MPMLSKAMNRAMHAAAAGHSTIGIPQAVAQRFVDDSHGQKVKRLPERLHKKKKRRKRHVFGALHGAGHYMGDMPE